MRQRGLDKESNTYLQEIIKGFNSNVEFIQLLSKYELNIDTFWGYIIHNLKGESDLDIYGDVIDDVVMAINKKPPTGVTYPKTLVSEIVKHKVADAWRKKGKYHKTVKLKEPEKLSSIRLDREEAEIMDDEAEIMFSAFINKKIEGIDDEDIYSFLASQHKLNSERVKRIIAEKITSLQPIPGYISLMCEGVLNKNTPLNMVIIGAKMLSNELSKKGKDEFLSKRLVEDEEICDGLNLRMSSLKRYKRHYKVREIITIPPQLSKVPILQLQRSFGLITLISVSDLIKLCKEMKLIEVFQIQNSTPGLFEPTIVFPAISSSHYLEGLDYVVTCYKKIKPVSKKLKENKNIVIKTISNIIDILHTSIKKCDG